MPRTVVETAYMAMGSVGPLAKVIGTCAWFRFRKIKTGLNFNPKSMLLIGGFWIWLAFGLAASATRSCELVGGRIFELLLVDGHHLYVGCGFAVEETFFVDS